MATWEEVAQDWGGRMVDAAIALKVTQPYEIDKLRLQALGEGGYYSEGQPGVSNNGSAPLVIPSGLVILGAVVVLFFVLKD